jgi:hypothetical protein
METKEVMQNISLSEVNLYRPHWLKGYVLQKKFGGMHVDSDLDIL